MEENQRRAMEIANEMIESGRGEEVLAAFRKILVELPKKAHPVSDVLVDLIDGKIPLDSVEIQKAIADKALDSFNDGEIDEGTARRYCGMKSS